MEYLLDAFLKKLMPFLLKLKSKQNGNLRSIS
jgi:hypothetical protein